ncbi:MAG: cyclic pyranopterin monophosphate synthase MoaC [Tissierellia bacterium]|nr:cyclic pyranopterin monophosphate synthase MoaC [Tissierellia bacterium]
MFTHMDENLRGHMVDISEKDVTLRQARAGGSIMMQKNTLEALLELRIKKGDVLAIAQIAAIQGAKKTPDLIPLAHPLLLQGVSGKFEIIEEGIYCEVVVKCQGKTGVEMEALTACAAGLLTIYDMCKAIDKTMEITGIRL